MLRAVPYVLRGADAWKVEIRHGGKRQRIFRATKAEALQAARDVVEARESGEGTPSLSGRELLAWMLESGITVGEARRALEARRGASSRLIADAVKAYLDAPREVPLSRRHVRDFRGRLRVFAEAFPGRALASIKAGELEDWVRSKGGSARNYFSAVRALFRFAIRREWVTVNLAERIERPVAVPREKPVLTPEQMRKALRLCLGLEPGIVRDSGGKATGERYEPLLLFLVLGGFCGLRSSEAMRLERADIDLRTREIHVRRMKTGRKGIRERFVRLPRVAALWLKECRLPALRVIEANEKNLNVMRRRLAAALGIAWPHNALRRSFASYHLAAFEDAAKTAEILGHTDAETTKGKYRAARRRDIGKAWFALTPKDVLSTKNPDL